GPAELEEALHEVVVAGVEVEPLGDDVACLLEVVVRLLDGAHRLDLREPRDRVGLDVDDDARRDVVDDDRPVARARDRLEVRDDAALRRLVVVRRDDQERIGAELVRLLGQMDRVRGRVRPGAGDHRGRLADRLDRGTEQVEALVVGERRALARRPRDHEPVGAVLHKVAGELLERVEVDRAVVPERRDDRGEDPSEHLPGGYSARLRRTCPGAWHRCYANRSRTTRSATSSIAASAPARRRNVRSYGRPASPTSASGAASRRRSSTGSTLRCSYSTSAASARSKLRPSGARQSMRSTVSSSPLRSAFSCSRRTASSAQSTAVTSAPRAAATSAGSPSPQPSSTTRTRASRSGRASASATAAGHSSAQYGRNSSAANASSSISSSGAEGRSSASSTPPARTVSSLSALRAARRGRP